MSRTDDGRVREMADAIVLAGRVLLPLEFIPISNKTGNEVVCKDMAYRAIEAIIHSPLNGRFDEEGTYIDVTALTHAFIALYTQHWAGTKYTHHTSDTDYVQFRFNDFDKGIEIWYTQRG